VRDPDGLAVSTRNAFLGPEERRAATVLHRALRAGKDAVRAGTSDANAIEEAMRATAEAESAVALEYASVVADGRLEPLSTVAGDVALLIAARVGAVRLIDNLRVVR
jgi:pantoate--beta-alanine ligase